MLILFYGQLSSKYLSVIGCDQYYVNVKCDSPHSSSIMQYHVLVTSASKSCHNSDRERTKAHIPQSTFEEQKNTIPTGMIAFAE